MASIELRHVTKRYGNAVLAVSDISLDIKDGDGAEDDRRPRKRHQR
jgi:ABC-type sugar transport system ATPase subunit